MQLILYVQDFVSRAIKLENPANGCSFVRSAEPAVYAHYGPDHATTTGPPSSIHQPFKQPDVPPERDGLCRWPLGRIRCVCLRQSVSRY